MPITEAPTNRPPQATASQPEPELSLLSLNDLEPGRYLGLTAIIDSETSPASDLAPALFLATEQGSLVRKLAEGNLGRMAGASRLHGGNTPQAT